MYGTKLGTTVQALPRMAFLDGYPESVFRERLGDEIVDASLALRWLRQVDGCLEITGRGWRAIEGRRRAAAFSLRHPG